MRMQRYALMAVGLGLAALFSVNTLSARHGHGRGDGKGWNTEKHLKMMTKKLDLGDDQQAQLKTILEEKKEKMQDLQKQMQDLRGSTHDKIKAVLNEKQLKRFEKMLSKKHKKKGKWRHKSGCECKKCKWKDK